MLNANNLPVLLVESDEIEVLTMQRAMQENSIANPLIVCKSGDQGLKQLNNSFQTPKLILLDIKADAFTFLDKVKRDPKLRRVPIVLLTSSVSDQTKCIKQNVNAAGYMVKPNLYNGYKQMVNAIRTYWSLSQLPQTA